MARTGQTVVNSTRAQVIKIRLLTEKRCCFFLHIFSSVKINVFHAFFGFRLKMHVRCDNQQKTGAEVGTIFLTADAVWVHWYPRFLLGAWMLNEGLPRLSADCKILIDFVWIQPQCIRLDGLVVDFFWSGLSIISYRDYIVNRSSFISCSLACSYHSGWLYASLNTTAQKSQVTDKCCFVMKLI